MLGLVPSNYLKAKQYYLEVKEIEKAADEFEFNDEVVVVRKSGNGDKSKMIDMEGI